MKKIVAGMTDHLAGSMREWEVIGGFAGWAEFEKFADWIRGQMAAGAAIEVPVERLYSGSSLIEQKWFRHAQSGKVWRLVQPDPPFQGVFEPIPDKD